MIDAAKVGNRIAEMRREKSLTQAQLAALVNVSHQAVSKWESGQTLPDIETLVRLTAFFGVTVEQLLSNDENSEVNMNNEENFEKIEEEQTEDRAEEKNGSKMTLQQLLQMAPFMSKEAVESIVMSYDEKLTALQIARLAPYLHAESIDALIAKHRPTLTWDALRRIAPYMSRESVDELARSIASGKETISPTSEEFNKTMDDIGKTFDDIGKGVERVVKKALRIGNSVLNDVSDAIVEEIDKARKRSERTLMIRTKAFERALEDGNWEWIGKHIEELEEMPELKAAIAAKARELGMHDWISRYMAACADEATIDKAVENGDWEWLGDNAWSFDKALQERVALAAMRAENWQWLGMYADQLDLKSCGYEIAEKALTSGATVLAKQLAEGQLSQEDKNRLARKAFDIGDDAALELLVPLTDDSFQEQLLLDLADKGDWKHVEECVKTAPEELIEQLMEKAVEQGNFDAVDMLDEQLK